MPTKIILLINKEEMEVILSKNGKKFKYDDPNYKEYQKQYRREYYINNKEKIAIYQQIYYKNKKGYSPDKDLNWKGKKVKGLVFERKTVILNFD